MDKQNVFNMRIAPRPLVLMAMLMGLTAMSLYASVTEANKQERPNIVIFIADDLGYGELGCQGNPQIPTPFIDAISSMDLFPTCAAAAQAKIPENLDGVDLMPFLLGEKNEAPHKILDWRQGSRTALRKGDWKIVFNPRSKAWELFNLAEDLTESENLVSRSPEKANELIGEWDELNQQMIKAVF